MNARTMKRKPVADAAALEVFRSRLARVHFAEAGRLIRAAYREQQRIADDVERQRSRALNSRRAGAWVTGEYSA